MKNYLFPFIILFALTACKEKVEERPTTVLSEDSMVMLMIDVHLLEAAIAQKNLPRDSSLLIYDLYAKDLFLKHGLNDSTYKENFNYYATRPAHMLTVYERVVDSLSWHEERRHGGEQLAPKDTSDRGVQLNDSRLRAEERRAQREQRKIRDLKKRKTN